ncbi:hypothetical protein [Pseudovibrio sp. Tun.PSC04-5.I4]|uniref:hypothetical protein n=1 Tax=Pseudovibrio sp. Tun.PSC04-5.I4 TaxID=1798213 RepID=UPI00088757A6|nr:hypothetical protein [Pseudovibrio sp. Tun.PSC04-5.I4]SDQ23096.1 autotransporter-associated beta strand repeat-containing protein [Pseudovibrio sp. Tun.PSC04-5.I4]
MESDGSIRIVEERILTIDGIISNSGLLTKTGTLILTAINTWTGGLSIDEDEIQFDDLSNLGTSTTTLNGGILIYTAFNEDSASGEAVLGENASVFSIQDSSSKFEISTDLAGAAGLTIQGDSTTELTGNNSGWSGDITVVSSTLELSEHDSLSIRKLTLNDSTLIVVPSGDLALDNFALTGTSSTIDVEDPSGSVTISDDLTGPTNLNTTGSGK